MSLSKLFQLPNEVFSHVLANPVIPLGRSLHLRLLSNRCCDIIERALKIKSSLVIREEDDEFVNRKPDDLVIKRDALTSELIRTLVRLFPEPKELTLALSSTSWSTVPWLFTQLDTTNLAKVKLYGEMEESNVKPIADSLVALSALTSLTLIGYHWSTSLLPHLKPVLPRLFQFNFYGYLDPFSVSLITSSLSHRCTHLMLNTEAFASFSGPFLAQLSASLTHLKLEGNAYHRNIWQSLSPMHRLTSLALDLSKCTLESSFFTNLAPLTSLTDVKLYNLVYPSPLALPAKKETPLAGIKRLTLELVSFSDYTQFDCQLFIETLSVWFLSLVHFTLIIDGGNIAAIRASLGELPFAVEILDNKSVCIWSPDW